MLVCVWPCYCDITLFSILQPLVTKELISRLLLSSDDELIDMLKNTISWRFGKVRSWFCMGGL